MRGGTLRYQADDSAFRIRPSSVKGSLGEPFSLEMTRDVTVWDEGDVMRVEGRIVGDCGLQWYDPCREGGDLYVSHILRARGTLLGQRSRDSSPSISNTWCPEPSGGRPRTSSGWRWRGSPWASNTTMGQSKSASCAMAAMTGDLPSWPIRMDRSS